jgi:hypothetical protein
MSGAIFVLLLSQSNLQIGVEVGPYRPAIDSEFEGSTPFQTIFGDKLAVMTRFRGAWLFEQPFGKIGASVSGGWAQKSARALTEDGGRSGGKTSFRLYPVSALLHLRGDALAEVIPVPLIPYGAVGLNYTFWRITRGDGSTARAAGERASGGSPGWEAMLGVALLLDRLDAKSAKLLLETFGIAGVELTFQGVYVQSLGRDRLRVGDLTWSGGLAVSF